MAAGADEWLLVSALISLAGCFPVVYFHCRHHCCRRYRDNTPSRVRLRSLEAAFGYATLANAGFVAGFLPRLAWHRPALPHWLLVSQLCLQQFCATAIAGWNLAILREYSIFSGCVERALLARERAIGPAAPSPPDRSDEWQTPALSIISYMRDSDNRRQLLKADEAGARRGAGLVLYHCLIWPSCVVVTLCLSLANLVLVEHREQIAEDGLRIVGVAAPRHQQGARGLETANALCLFGPFAFDVVVGLFVLLYHGCRQRRITGRIMREQPLHVAPISGRLPLAIVLLFLLTWSLPTWRRLESLLWRDEEHAAEWDGVLNTAWAICLGGQGIGTAAIGIAVARARRQDRSSAVRPQGDG